MEQRRVHSVILMLLVAFSLFLTYVQLYNPLWFTSIAEPEQADVSITPRRDEYSRLSEFYHPTRLSFEQTLRPINYYYRIDGESYWLKSNEFGQTLEAYLSSRPIEIKSKHMVSGDYEGYMELLSGDYIEINFPEVYPIEALTNYILIEDDERFEEENWVNQIIIPLNDNQQVYIANSFTHSFMRGELSDHLKKDELRVFLSEIHDGYIPVERYSGRNQYLYLPINSFEVSSRVYALEQIPQQLYISQIFPEGTDQSFSESISGSLIYKSYQYTLDINPKTKRLDYVISRINQGEEGNSLERMRNSFQQIQPFEYWSEGLRLTKHANSKITYRRFVEGMPIYSAPNMPDYGTSVVHLRGNDDREVARYQTSMLTFKAYLDNLYQDYTLESGQELTKIFEDYGYTFNRFEHATVGYEWQSDMEDFKKVTLIPKWYFSFNGTMYSLNELQTPEFESIWKAAMEEDN